MTLPAQVAEPKDIELRSQAPHHFFNLQTVLTQFFSLLIPTCSNHAYL